MSLLKLRIRWRHLRHFRHLSRTEQWLLIQALCWLPLMHGGVRSIGFTRGCRLLTRWTARRPSISTPEQAQQTIQQCEQALHWAVHNGLHPGNCLSRSLTLWWLLRRQGVDSDLCIGVRTVAGHFQAHAWIEYQGQPLHEVPDVRQHYAAFPHELFGTVTQADRYTQAK